MWYPSQAAHHLTLLKLVVLLPSVVYSYDWADVVD